MRKLWQWCLVLSLAFGATACASLPANADHPPSQAFSAPDQTALGQLVAQRRGQDKARNDSGFALLAGEADAFDARLALIADAQRTLDLQYYAIHADASTEVLLEGLRRAARRGVRVRILLDDFNTVGKDAQVLRLAFEPNVQIRLFNPLPGSRSTLLGRIATSITDMDRIQKRMHNKLFIADNAMGIAGGRNLGDAYFGGDGNSNFVDLDVLAAGRIVRDMSASFDRYWNDDLAYPMQTLVSAKQLDELKKAPEPAREEGNTPAPGAGASQGSARTEGVRPVATAVNSVLPNMTATSVQSARGTPMDLRAVRFTWAPSLLLVDKPGKIGPDDDEVNAGDTAVDGLLELIGQAKRDVLIVSPYFVPGPVMMDLFRQLHARGVTVRVLTNSLASNDAVAAHAGYARYREQLLQAGVELHEMRAEQEPGSRGLAGSAGGSGSSGGGGSKSGTSKASLHSKVVVVDQRSTMIGSMNLDLRSQKQNSEVGLLVRSAAFARETARHIESMIASGSYQLALESGHLVWHAPPGAPFKDEHSEPLAGIKLRAMAAAIAPFAPDEML